MGLLDRLLGPLRGRTAASPDEGEAVSHGQPPEAPPGVPAEIRAETWDRPDGTRVHLLVAAARGTCAVHALLRDPGGLAFRAGTDLFVGEAIDSCGDALVDALTLHPVDRRDIARLRLLPPEPDRLVLDVANLLDMLANHPLLRGSERTQVPAGPLPLPPRHPSGLVDVIEARDVRGLNDLGHDARSLLPAPRAQTDRTVTVLDPCVFPRGRLGDENRAVLAETVLPWFEVVRSDVLPTDRPALSPATWTAEAFAHYAAGGEAGLRRSQAAAVHPGLSPVMATVPALRDLVDAGRPFEDALAAALGEMCGHPALPPARMRRLRTLAAPPPATGPGGLNELLNVAANLPLERLPASAAGWDALFPHVGTTVLRIARRNGLDLAELLKGLQVDFGLPDLMPAGLDTFKDPVDAFVAAAVGVDDMVEACAALLIAPLGLPHADPRLVAARILMAGRTMLGVVETQAEWHRLARIAAAERAGAPRPNLTWPALFPPYAHDNGVVVRCLTSTAELVAEGGVGADAQGIAGLAHCVDSYDRQCCAGQKHIASVRIEKGRTVRISTVEVRVCDPDLALLETWQHRASHNAPPPNAAEAAVQSLYRDIAERLHPFDPEAARTRTPLKDMDGPFDPEIAFATWRPLMTRRAAKAGLPGLVGPAP